ncbi:hypothetical protein B0H13DRAFT_1096770 [Mycena leptocephala]|nr:hypothetical protein B0H13DRAFT_1096770 [Mycena leptocephala]
MQCLENDLVAIFNALAQHGNLQILQWKIYRWYRGNRVVFSADVWTAISNAAVHLRELDFCIQVGESETWWPLACNPPPNLAIFRIYLPDAHGWDCEDLQTLLNTLSTLEELSLRFPGCCGPCGLTFRSTHPRLKAFSSAVRSRSPRARFYSATPYARASLSRNRAVVDIQS